MSCLVPNIYHLLIIAKIISPYILIIYYYIHINIIIYIIMKLTISQWERGQREALRHDIGKSLQNITIPAGPMTFKKYLNSQWVWRIKIILELIKGWRPEVKTQQDIHGERRTRWKNPTNLSFLFRKIDD